MVNVFGTLLYVFRYRIADFGLLLVDISAEVIVLRLVRDIRQGRRFKVGNDADVEDILNPASLTIKYDVVWCLDPMMLLTMHLRPNEILECCSLQYRFTFIQVVLLLVKQGNRNHQECDDEHREDQVPDHSEEGQNAVAIYYKWITRFAAGIFVDIHQQLLEVFVLVFNCWDIEPCAKLVDFCLEIELLQHLSSV